MNLSEVTLGSIYAILEDIHGSLQTPKRQEMFRPRLSIVIRGNRLDAVIRDVNRNFESDKSIVSHIFQIG